MGEDGRRSLEDPYDGRALAEALQRVLDLQIEYSSRNSPPMSERGELIRNGIPGLVKPWLDKPWRVQGSDGIGRKARVPWVRVYDPDRSPKATNGWYVVLLFSEDGSSVYISLNQGTQVPIRGGRDMKSRPREEVEGAAKRARRQLSLQSDSPLVAPLSLGSSKLAGDYAAGSVAAFGYTSGRIPDDSELIRAVQVLLSMNEDLDPRLDAPRSERAIAVYVGTAATENLSRGLAEGFWGWRRFHDDYEKIREGDLLLFGTGYTGGSPRKGPTEFAVHGFERVIQCQIASRVTTATDPFWPDEQRNSRVIYPNRIQLTEFRELGGMTVAELNERYGADVGEALRVSASSGGRGVIVEISGDQDEPDIDVSGVSLADVSAAVGAALRASGLNYGERHESLVRSFIASLATKRLVLLTGLSGSGKTRLALAFGQWLGADRYRVVPVRPDWTGPDALLGYENQLSEARDGSYAWVVPDTLEFMLRAARDPMYPYLLLLDEMNLAHVERYFADVLSGIESAERILPDLAQENGEWRQLSTNKLPFPPNLFVVGTVNIDETTYMFSPKVLDRANTLEFRVLTDDLDGDGVAPTPVLPGPEKLAMRFLHDATDGYEAHQWAGRSAMAAALVELHENLSAIDREFGHRVFQEALRFGSLLAATGQDDWRTALDLQVMQKVLPRFHGSVKQIAEPLQLVGSWAFSGPGQAVAGDFNLQSPPDGEPALPVSFDKIRRMHRRVLENHFVSFAE